MKILAVSDVEAKTFYDYYTPGKLRDYDLILSCGDLKPEYLEFLVTMARCPLYYVHGNHDENFSREPEGCDCVDGRLVVYKGVRILGLGGSHRYREGEYMYSERAMSRRLWRLGGKIRRSGGFDILLTHAPARGINDMDTPAHRGFACFTRLLDTWHPRYFLHGHIHLNYGADIPRRMEHNGTTVINAYEYYSFEY